MVWFRRGLSRSLALWLEQSSFTFREYENILSLRRTNDTEVGWCLCVWVGHWIKIQKSLREVEAATPRASSYELSIFQDASPWNFKIQRGPPQACCEDWRWNRNKWIVRLHVFCIQILRHPDSKFLWIHYSCYRSVLALVCKYRKDGEIESSCVLLLWIINFSFLVINLASSRLLYVTHSSHLSFAPFALRIFLRLNTILIKRFLL